jgi:hypothetical protein
MNQEINCKQDFKGRENNGTNDPKMDKGKCHINVFGHYTRDYKTGSKRNFEKKSSNIANNNGTTEYTKTDNGKW